ncbi:MAG: hypothetical protein H7070_04185 [Saprospiraceae bacterium]|nr:hypothetical protein [Pyrinomonadaceae bacterium]
MIAVKVTYTVKSDFVAENRSNITKFLEDVRDLNNPGIRYTVLLGDDGKTHTHLSMYKSEAAQKELLELDSFNEFQRRRDESGLEAPPKVEMMTIVDSSYEIF